MATESFTRTIIIDDEIAVKKIKEDLNRDREDLPDLPADKRIVPIKNPSPKSLIDKIMGKSC